MGGFADHYGATNIHPIGLAALVVLAILTFTLPRRHALLPLIIGACTVPMAQRIVVAGADFTFLRLLILAGILRILFRQETVDFRKNRLDLAVLAWVTFGTVIMTLHYGDSATLINRLGWAFDILGTYFLVRIVIRNTADLFGLARAVALTSVPVAAAFIVEWTTRFNMFSVFGGVPAETVIRFDRLRCQGAFAHPILAGTFWAAALPLIWNLYATGRSGRQLATIGTICCVVIIAACSSSTPVLSLLVAAAGLSLFKLRHYRTHIWIGGLMTLVALHIVMNKPVWHLMARVDVVGGSTGWHRYRILDAFINNFSEWFASGESNPMSWGVWQMRDITNQYVLEGLRGGLLTLLAFITVLVIAFANVGRHLRQYRHSGSSAEMVQWLIGVALVTHVVTFLGVSYFGQMITIFYLQLALAAPMLIHRSERNTIPVDRSAGRTTQANAFNILPARTEPTPPLPVQAPGAQS